MKTEIQHRMTGEQIHRFYANQNTPAARLARWQSLSLARRARLIQERADEGGKNVCRPCGMTDPTSRADWRRALIHGPAFAAVKTPSTSEPGHDEHLLWLADFDHTTRELTPDDRGSYPLDHTGWFTCDEYVQETIQTCAVTLPEFPALAFYCTRESFADGIPVYLDTAEPVAFQSGDFEIESDYDYEAALLETMRSVIRSNDYTTERNAEEQRRFFERDQLERELEENTTERNELRTELADIIQDLRNTDCAAITDNIRRAIKSQVKNTLAEMDKLAARNQEIQGELA